MIPWVMPRPGVWARNGDGSWPIDGRWDPFTRLPGDFRWWRRILRDTDIVEFQLTDDHRGVWVTVVLDGLTRVPILADEVARARLIRIDCVPTGDYAHTMITTSGLVVDLLTNLPPARLLPWSPVTDPGDTNPPDENDRYPIPIIYQTARKSRIEQRSTWLPPSERALDIIRTGVR